MAAAMISRVTMSGLASALNISVPLPALYSAPNREQSAKPTKTQPVPKTKPVVVPQRKALNHRERKEEPCPSPLPLRVLSGLPPRSPRLKAFSIPTENRFPDKQARPISHPKRHASPNHHPPGPRHARAQPQIQLHSKPKHHPHHRPALVRPPREHSQQKHAQQRAICNRRNLQPHLHHAPHFIQRQHRQREQQQRPEQSRHSRKAHLGLLVCLRTKAHIKGHDRT